MFEDALARSIFTQNVEKTFIDKILAKDEVERVRQLVRKDRLKRQDILEILYMLSGVESKLWNFSAWDRYINCKFFVWIREFVMLMELIMDHKDDMQIKQKKGLISLSPRYIKLLDDIQRQAEHNVKFLIDLYFNIGRTTLSNGATGFLEALRNKFDINYTAPPPKEEKVQQPVIHLQRK